MNDWFSNIDTNTWQQPVARDDPWAGFTQQVQPWIDQSTLEGQPNDWLLRKKKPDINPQDPFAMPMPTIGPTPSPVLRSRQPSDDPYILAEESAFQRKAQKTDPLGDNLILPGDMRHLYKPPEQLPWPLDKLNEINKYLFGDPAIKWQQQQDEILDKKKREEQLKEYKSLQKHRDFKKRMDETLLQFRKPSDYPDQPDPLLNPYKEPGPFESEKDDSLFRAPPTQDLPENYPRLVQGNPLDMLRFLFRNIS